MITELYWSLPQKTVPNNRLPLLIHRNALPDAGVETILGRFRQNGWSNNWTNPGVYSYAHFHSTTHECLGCAQGWMELKLSVGENGSATVRVSAGDIIVMPAGVSHQDIGHSDDNMMCGGYPDGRDWDNIQQEFLSASLYQQACKRIMSIPIPGLDPVTGASMQDWHTAPPSTEKWNEWRNDMDKSS